MFKFLTTRPLWVNILAGVGILILLLLLFLGSLDLLTRHGKVLKIPQVTGLSLAEAKKTLQMQGFEVLIQDSIYFDTIPPQQVIKQFPEADNLVKVNRTVYLTINRAVAPFIDMPNLVSMSSRNAGLVLRQYGLKLEDTVYKPDFARNSVLDVLYKGESIKPGTKIQQGSGITLVLGNGIGTSDLPVPDLFGLTYRQVRAVLDSGNMILGAVVPDANVTDTASAFVYRQSPPQINDEMKPNHIRQGQSIDVWLSVQRPDRKVDTTTTVTPR
ncbi:MAG: PASTA domain-containing protein [Puia sp.]|nr:PASTA domain-containing protein [Puia sp.]